MSGLFPAGSEEGEEERTGGGKQKGRDASVGAVYPGGVIQGSFLLSSVAVWQKARPSCVNDSNSSLVNWNRRDRRARRSVSS